MGDVMRILRRIGELPGWKRFGFEVAIILVGVGLALLANQWVSDATRAKETRQALNAVERDLIALLLISSERLAVEPCRVDQVETLAGRLRQSDGQWTGTIPESLNRDDSPMVLPMVLRSPIRNWPAGSWNALLASDIAIHMDRDVFVLLGVVFDLVRQIQTLQADALALRGRLSHLGVSGPLDAAERREAYAVLGELSAMEGLLSVLSGQMRSLLVAYRYQYPGRLGSLTDDPVGVTQAFIEAAIDIYGECVDSSEFQPVRDQIAALRATP